MELDEHVWRSRAVFSRSAGLYAATVGTEVTAAVEAAEDRALLAAFAELVGERGGPVADLGCGTGRVTRLLADAGLDVVGFDLAPGMIAEARSAHPDLVLGLAELARLPFADGSLAGVVAWYSVISTPPDRLGPVWDELGRVLHSEGVALVAFQAGGGERVERPDAYGTGVDLTLHRHDPEAVCRSLAEADLPVRTVVRRRPVGSHDGTDQALIIIDRRTAEPR